MSLVVRLDATFASRYNRGRVEDETPANPQAFNLAIEFPADAEAEAAEVAGLFPKSAKVRTTTCSGPIPETGAWGVRPLVTARVSLVSDGTTGAVNETGIRRVRRILAEVERRGWTIEWTARCVNSYPTLGDLLAAVDALVPA